MADKGVILCDTNIIIEFYKGNEAIISELKKIGQKNIAISIVTVAELIYGAINKKELQQIKRDLSTLRTILIDDEISYKHIELLTEYSLSHRLNLPDALIAATAIQNDLSLYTLNKKDFQYIDALELYAD